MKRLKWHLTLKSNQENEDCYKNVFKRRQKVSRDGASKTLGGRLFQAHTDAATGNFCLGVEADPQTKISVTRLQVMFNQWRG